MLDMKSGKTNEQYAWLQTMWAWSAGSQVWSRPSKWGVKCWQCWAESALPPLIVWREHQCSEWIGWTGCCGKRPPTFIFLEDDVQTHYSKERQNQKSLALADSKQLFVSCIDKSRWLEPDEIVKCNSWLLRLFQLWKSYGSLSKNVSILQCSLIINPFNSS